MSRLPVVALCLAGFACALAAAPAARAQSASSLENRMGEEAFQAAGLDKLSPRQLQRLETWLDAHGTTLDADGARSGSQAANADTHQRATSANNDHEDNEREKVKSRLDGEFHGWNGHKTFHLANGQVWRQTGNDTWNPGVSVKNPKVIIKPSLFGSWLLELDAFNASTRVHRVK